MINEKENVQQLFFSSQQLLFKFNNNNSSYQAQINIQNKSNQTIYFKVISTFGQLLSFSPDKKCIKDNSNIKINFKLKIPNQINKNGQFIYITYSQNQQSSHFYSGLDRKILIKVNFYQNLPQNEQIIINILKEDCKQLCEQAKSLLKQGLIKKALYKYQQSFLLYRQYPQGSYGMAQCYLLMQQQIQGINSIQTNLLLHSEPRYQWLRLKLIFEFIKNKYKDIKLIKLLKKQIEKIEYSQTDIEKTKNQMINLLNQEQQMFFKEKGGQLVFNLISKTLNQYQDDQNLKILYKNDKQLIQKQLNEVFGLQSSHKIQEAPQFILDPITYQIMYQPVIGPSGHSYEKKSLFQYLKRHQNKDLFTRKELRPQWVRTNLALKKFILQNSKLKNWEQYEKQIIEFK